MFGLLVSLFDLGVLAHGTIKNEKESSKSRKEAILRGEKYYVSSPYGQFRSTENNHRVSVSKDGVKDLETGKVIDDYRVKRLKERRESELKEKEYEKKILNEEFVKYRKLKRIWFYSSTGYYYNSKNKLKAHEYGYRRFPGALYDDEFRYYVDNRLFYVIRENDGTITDVNKEHHKKLIESEKKWGTMYKEYLKEIEYNNSLFKKYNNKEYIDKYNIEIVPVSNEEFFDKFEKVK